jgi:hypothetical protein
VCRKCVGVFGAGRGGGERNFRVVEMHKNTE